MLKQRWEWYKSGDRSIDKLGQIYGKIPPIWEKMADSNRNVNSNYGYQWQRNNQIDYVCAKLRQNKNTRHAAISIYDAKEWSSYQKDTPCTYAVQFTILDNKLNMSVLMRSNDIWYGFCNDQYQFSIITKNDCRQTVTIDVGTGITIFAHNMHLYNDKL